MNYYLKKNGLYLTKTKGYVTEVELDKAWGFELYLGASQMAMKLGGDFEIVATIEVFMRFIRNEKPAIEILKGGLEEKRQKIYEQANEIIQLKAANAALLNRLKTEYGEK
jgi:hypothetical protein